MRFFADIGLVLIGGCWAVQAGGSWRSVAGWWVGRSRTTARLQPRPPFLLAAPSCPSPTDEVHLLNENRGSSLEGVVARIKVVSRCGKRGRRGHLSGRVRPC